MELHKNIRTANIKSNNSQSNFKIAASAKAFKILSDGIYSDKITAVIRELSTNAYDSHVEAHKTHTPFDVHLPIPTEPWFSIKDYGTGMSKDKIENLYSTYFDSDRNTSNEFIGALGLGSKSPFAYTDSFTVESNYNGKKYIFNCFINEDGSPQVVELHNECTSEANGVEVKFSVDEEDFREFEYKTKKVLSIFKRRPNILGKHIIFPYQSVVLAGDDWELLYESSYRNCIQAIQGNVAYEIDKDFLSEYDIDPIIVRFFSNMALNLYFQIGELDVAASREQLSYDETTIQNVIHKIEKAYNEINHVVHQIINDEKSYWDARKKVLELDGLVHISRINKTVYYNSIPIELNKAFKFVFDDTIKILKYQRSRFNDNIERKVYFDPEAYIHYNQNPIIIINDESSERKCIIKTRWYIKHSDYETVAFIVNKKDWKNSYKKRFHNVIVKRSTKLEKPNPESKQKQVYRSYIDITKYLYLHDLHSSRFIDYHDVDLNASHLYIGVKNQKFIYNDVKIYNIDKLIKFLKEYNITGESTKIYGVKTGEQKTKRFKQSNWKNIIDVCSQYIQKEFDGYQDVLEKFITIKDNKSYSIRDKNRFFNDNIAARIIDKTSYYFTVKKAFDIIREYKINLDDDEMARIENLISISNSIPNFSMVLPQSNINITELLDEYERRYPLLKRYDMPVYCDENIEYINAIDVYRNNRFLRKL